jgi:hypothetical protein
MILKMSLILYNHKRTLGQYDNLKKEFCAVYLRLIFMAWLAF